MQYIHTIYTMHWIMRATVVGSNSSVYESPSKNQDLESSVENRGKLYGPQPVYCWLFVVYHVGNMVTRLSRLGVRTAEPGYRSGINRVRQQVSARARALRKRISLSVSISSLRWGLMHLQCWLNHPVPTETHDSLENFASKLAKYVG